MASSSSMIRPRMSSSGSIFAAQAARPPGCCGDQLRPFPCRSRRCRSCGPSRGFVRASALGSHWPSEARPTPTWTSTGFPAAGKERLRRVDRALQIQPADQVRLLEHFDHPPVRLRRGIEPIAGQGPRPSAGHDQGRRVALFGKVQEIANDLDLGPRQLRRPIAASIPRGRSSRGRSDCRECPPQRSTAGGARFLGGAATSSRGGQVDR